MEKIVCTHLYNDFSGSPLILSTVVKGFLEKGMEVEVLTSSAEAGFLSDLPVRYVDNKYQFAENKLLRIVLFFWTQLRSFFQMLQYRDQEVVVYVNTLLPFGVALAGKWMNKKVVYHIHETSVKPAMLKGLLKWVAAKTADELIYVSDFLRKQEPIGNVSSKVVYNALSNDFIETAKTYKKNKKENSEFIVLMLCSLKAYKGVGEFVEIARGLPNLSFELVLNAEQTEIDAYFKNNVLPENLTLFPKQNNVHIFYQRADLVINLSHPEQWVETFGMTLLEGMQYGLPAISPPVGGCTEFVEHGVNGFQLDQRDLSSIVKEIATLSLDNEQYNEMSNKAKQMATRFNVADMCLAICLITLGSETIIPNDQLTKSMMKA